jgi:hypothetical protein
MFLNCYDNFSNINIKVIFFKETFKVIAVFFKPFFMKVLFIHQYFKTSREPGCTRPYFISLALVNAGHEVIMITQNKTAKENVFSKCIDGMK